MPERNAAGEYEIHFFTHGLRHYPVSAQQRAAECIIGEELMLMHLKERVKALSEKVKELLFTLCL
jgi:hypothetical protein